MLTEEMKASAEDFVKRFLAEQDASGLSSGEASNFSMADMFEDSVVALGGQGSVAASASPRAVRSAFVPQALVGDPVVQKMIDGVSSALRGVKASLFSRFDYVTCEQRGDHYVLFFIGSLSVDIRLGVFYGTDGHIKRVLFSSGRVKTKAWDIISLNDLTEVVSFVGTQLVGGVLNDF